MIQYEINYFLRILWNGLYQAVIYRKCCFTDDRDLKNVWAGILTALETSDLRHHIVPVVSADWHDHLVNVQDHHVLVPDEQHLFNS